MSSRFFGDAAWSAWATNWLVTDWYLDGVTGSDANDGRTALTPLRSGAELLRRLGPYAIWPQSVTIHVGPNGLSDGIALHGLMVNPQTHLDVVGTPTQLVDAGTVATYAALNHATPVATQITATGVVDLTTYVNKRIRVTAGARAGAVSWVAKVSPGGVGVATARVSPPVYLETASTTQVYTYPTLVAGDPVVVESLPHVPSIEIQLDGPVDLTDGVQYVRRQVMVRDLSVGTMGIQAPGMDLLRRVIVYGMRMLGMRTWATEVTNGTGLQVLGSLLSTTTPGSTVLQPLAGSFSGCLFGENAKAFTFMGVTAIGQSLFQDCRAVFTSTRIPPQLSGCQSFDCSSTSSAVAWVGGEIASHSGSGNSGIGLAISNGSLSRIRGTYNLTGTTCDVQLSVAPVVNLTVAQGLQTSDYAQKGTATIGATAPGYVDIVVPWWDPTTQRVTATVKDLLGTTGVLSIPSASRTNTGFRIQSTNVLDVSTVDWEISPLGRNVFISTT